jgi:hypothetical protein
VSGLQDREWPPQAPDQARGRCQTASHIVALGEPRATQLLLGRGQAIEARPPQPDCLRPTEADEIVLREVERRFKL